MLPPLRLCPQDPGFRSHKAVAQWMGLIGLELADAPIVPFTFGPYAEALADGLAKVRERQRQWRPGAAPLQPLADAIRDFNASAQRTDVEARRPSLDPRHFALQLRTLNDRLMLTERAFLLPEGVAVPAPTNSFTASSLSSSRSLVLLLVLLLQSLYFAQVVCCSQPDPRSLRRI